MLLVGTPNVGKSALFNLLIGTYSADVSNYPGTTVELATGRMRLGDRSFTLVDTPGLYSLLPIAEEERVTRALLDQGRHDLVLHVVDAKSLPRMLPLTFQLLEAGEPVMLVLNMIDEAASAGLSFDLPLLEKRLGIPVVSTSASQGAGMKELRERISAFARGPSPAHVDYGLEVERAVREMVPLLPPSCPGGLSSRARALLVLQEDRDLLAEVSARPTGAAEKVFALVNRLKKELPEPAPGRLTRERKRKAEEIAAETMRRGEAPPAGLSLKLDRLLLNPWTGVPILALVLYLLFYRFVGGFGVGVLERFLSHRVFGEWIIPWTDQAAEGLIPWPWLRELFAGEFGVVNMGVRYAVAIVLPTVGCVFLAFALIEDSGYLPRLSFLLDRVMKRIGLSGRAVIPITVGFGCGTMAMLMTRTLETRRERLVATALLALAIPCAPQLGIILGMASSSPSLLLVWGGTVAGVFLLTGFGLAKVLPGEASHFFIELPPLRLPRPGNVWIKTATRMKWYFMEILPIFLLVSVLIWAGRVTHLFDLLVRALAYPVQAIGLPAAASPAFLFGFFRRDYAAAALLDLSSAGGLTGTQAAVALVTLTLFIPCVSQVMVTAKVQGWRIALVVMGLVVPAAFLVGGLLNLALNALGVTL